MTHLLELFDPSEYVAAFELQGRDVTVTIARVVGGQVIGEDGKTAKKPIVYFSDWPKPLVLGKKMAKALIKLYGTEPKAYSGKQLTMYPTTEKCFGEMMEVVRIRPTVRKQSAPADKAPKPIGERVSAVKAALRGAIDSDAVEAVWRKTEAVKNELLQSNQTELLEDLTLTYESRLVELREVK